MDISKFQLKRVNPFQGLIIDADTWQDAHNYHRDQQRLHVLAFHQTGIISGLEVTANSPADTSVIINPGMAIDPDGNVIIVPQTALSLAIPGKRAGLSDNSVQRNTWRTFSATRGRTAHPYSGGLQASGKKPSAIGAVRRTGPHKLRSVSGCSQRL
jgi:hypothetical protein